MKNKLKIFGVILTIILFFSGVAISIPALEKIYGEKWFVNGIQIGTDPNNAIDPNGAGRFKCLAVGNATDYNYAFKSTDLPLCVNRDAIATTSTSGIELKNNTASTVGVPVQYSPSLNFYGSAWDTDGSSDTYDWKIEGKETSGSNTIGYLYLSCSKNGGDYTTYFYTGTNSTTYLTYLAASGYIVSSQNVVTTSTDGIYTQSNTPATSIAPVKMSPRFRLRGNVWNTTGAGSSESSDWIIENLPTSGTTPSSLLKFGYSANGGAYSYPFTVKNDGTFNNNGMNTLKASVATPADPNTAIVTLLVVSGFGTVICGSEKQYFSTDPNGTVTYDFKSLNSSNTQGTASNLNVYNDPNMFLCFQNKTGVTANIKYVVNY